MSIRLIAKDLYRLKQEVERFEAELPGVHPNQRGELEEKLREARAEMNQLQHMLDTAKEPLRVRLPR